MKSLPFPVVFFFFFNFLQERKMSPASRKQTVCSESGVERQAGALELSVNRDDPSNKARLLRYLGLAC